MKNQREWTIRQLKEHGEVSRNLALSLYFSRLGAVICTLRQEGWDIRSSKRNGDHVYTLLEAPKRLVWAFDLINGTRVPRATYIEV